MRWDGAVPGIPDARITTVPHLPDILPGAVAVGPHSQARPGALLRIVPGVGRFLASDGIQIEVAPAPGSDAGDVETYLYGGVRGALIHQRGELPLHASTVVSPSGLAVALAGPSGTGKSTLTARLTRRGWRLLVDDLTRITWNGDHALAWPGLATVKLMADACQCLGIDTEGLRRVDRDPEKILVEFPACPQPAPLGMVVLLHAGGKSTEEQLRGVPAFAALGEQIFRTNYLQALGQAHLCFKVVAKVASSCGVVRMDRDAAMACLARLEGTTSP